ncbi:MAG: LamG-like jellyroll fold domain-containing protein [Bacteroidales bacterium]
MKNERLRFWLLCFVVFLIWGTEKSLGQNVNYGVALLNKGPQETYLNTGINLNSLLKEGVDGAATVEFWVNSPENLGWSLTDLLNNNNSFHLDMDNEGNLHLVQGKSNFEIPISSEVKANDWCHLAMTFRTSGTTTTTSIFLNGNKKGEYPITLSKSEIRQMYVKKPADKDLMLTEIRAWNRERTNAQIQDEWHKSYLFSSPADLNEKKNQGLVVYLGSDDAEENAMENLPRLKFVEWKNMMPDGENASGKVLSSMDEIPIAKVTNEVSHPILDNNKIFLKASKGTYLDKISLAWPHIKGADGYRIYRDQVIVKTITDLSGIGISRDVTYEDKDVNPGKLYDYRVEAFSNSDKSFSSAGYDGGFIFFNGQISGNIKTTGDIYVDSVRLTATPKDVPLPGNAISFPKGSSSVVFNNVDVFRNKKSITVEFWYKPEESSNELNSIFQLGDLNVNLSGNKFEVVKGTTEIVSGDIKTSEGWHHYAASLGEGAAALYQDGVLVSASTNSYPEIEGNTQEFLFNAKNISAYDLDELRIWEGAKSEHDIKADYLHIISGLQDNLLLYYRFDMGMKNTVYNLAKKSRGYYSGEWDTTKTQPKWMGENSQPEQLVYGGYTDKAGNYELDAINYGLGDGITFKLEATKPNHEFSEGIREIKLARSLKPDSYQKHDIGYTDVSALPFSGRVYYSENDQKYPVPKGQTIMIDGQPVMGNDDSKTDAQGVYSITSPLGRHRIEVANQDQLHNFGTYSVKLDGEKDFLMSSEVFNGDTITYSGFLMFTEANQERESYILSEGDLSLVILPTGKMAVKNKNTKVLTSNFSVTPNEWHFFGLSYDKVKNTIKLMIDKNLDQNVEVPDINLAGNFVIGAKFEDGQGTLCFKGNIDQIELRHKAYNEDQLNNLREGDRIDGDEDAIFAIYPFEESEGTRSVSWTTDAQSKVLDFYGKPVHDNQVFYAFQRKYNYEYAAADSELAITDDKVGYIPNIVKPITTADFENKTRFGIIGNIVVPCGCGVGEWEGTVSRTDISGIEYTKNIGEDNFNSDFTVFTVDNLVPGQYRIEIWLKGKKSSSKLQSQIIDLRSGWTAYTFKYKNPLHLDAQIIRKVNVSNDGKESYSDDFEECDGNFILEKGTYYDMVISAYQEYEGKKCYIEGLKYTVDGDLGRTAPKQFGDENGKYVMSEAGIDTLRLLVAEPNFNAPYTRKLSIVANDDGTTTDSDLTAIITGVKQFNQDFTLDPPDEMIMVLHDPPGDQSSLTWTKGSSFSYSTNWSFDGGVKIKVDVSSGLDAEMYMGTWAGFGAGAVVMQRSVLSKAEGVFVTNQNIGAGGGTSDNNSVTLDQSIGTNDGGIIKGIDGDVYVGTAYVINMGRGKSLEMQDCKPVVNEEIVAVPQTKSMFAHTHQHIERVLIPNLELLKADAEKEKDTEAATEYQNKIDKWKALLAHNKEKFDKISDYDPMKFSNKSGEKEIETSFNFSAGTSTTWTISKSNAFNGSIYEFYSGDVVTDFATKFNAFGADISMKTGVTAYWNQKFNYNSGNEEHENFSIRFSDKTIGDQFDVLIKQDPEFGSPIFKTRSGRSMAPYEQGTVPREGLELVADKYHVYAEPGGQASFKLTLRNAVPIDDGKMKNYVLAIPTQTQPSGLTAKIFGGIFTSKDYWFNYGENIDAIITFEQNGNTEDNVFKDVPVVLYSPAEVNSGAYVYSKKYLDELGVKLADTVYLTAEFHENCVDNIVMETPKNNWVVNSNTGDNLDFRFKFDKQSAAFTKLLVEYAEGEDNTPKVLKEISSEDLQKSLDSEDFFNIKVDMSGMADGAYKLRLTPMCGLGNEGWRKQNPTDWVSGNVYRIQPVITQTIPNNNGILTDALIAANLDRDVLGDGVNSLNVSLRGVLAGMDPTPKAAIFNQVTDSIVIPPHKDLNAIDGAYSVEFWVYPEKYPKQEVPIITKGDNSINVSLSTNGSINNGRSLSAPLIPFKWTHVAVVYDGNHLARTFIDGDLSTEEKEATLFKGNSDTLVIGGTKSGDGFIGRLDEIRIWSKAITQEEIYTNKNAMLLGNEANLVAYFPLDENALEGEAVRDYTDKASGTTANGLTFTSEKDEAAPISAENVIQDVPVDVVLAEGNQIVIKPKDNFSDYYLEGALLTAKIEGSKIRDVYGNSLEGKSWSFRVNRNALEWTKANIDQRQKQGVSSEFEATLSNSKGAKEIKYTIEGLPSWLEVTGNHHANQEYELGAGYDETLHFKVAPWLNPGEHTTFVRAKTLSGVEVFKLKVTVESAKPAYNFNPEDFAYKMNMTAQLTINGVLSSDENDMVGAYVNGQIRGYGSIKHISSVDKNLVQLEIYSNKKSGEDLSFRVWDASESKEYLGVQEKYSFTSDNILGSLNTPVDLTTGNSLVKRLPFSKGYYWMTFALHSKGSEKLNITDVSGFGEGDTLEAKDGKIATFKGGAWTGDLKELSPEASYQVGLEANRVIEIAGEGIDVDVDIPLEASPELNWIGYLPENMMVSSEAMKSVSAKDAQNGDILSGREGFAEYHDGSWVGSLTHLAPGLGYRLKVTKAGTLNYLGISKADREAAKNGNLKSMERRDFIPNAGTPLVSIKNEAYTRGFNLQAQDYEHFMHIQGVVDGPIDIQNSPELILAYVNGKPAGVAVPQEVDGQWTYFATVYAHNTSKIEFRLIDRETQIEYAVKGKLDFKSGSIEGSSYDPYIFEVGDQIRDDSGYKSLEKNVSQNHPNPYHTVTTIDYAVNENTPVTIEIRNLVGQKVGVIEQGNQSVGSHSVNIGRIIGGNYLENGVYFYTLITNYGKVTKKMIIN